MLDAIGQGIAILTNQHELVELDLVAGLLNDRILRVPDLAVLGSNTWAKIDAEKAGGPNGLLARHDRLLLGGWVDRDAQGCETAGHLSALDYMNKTLECVTRS